LIFNGIQTAVPSVFIRMKTSILTTSCQRKMASHVRADLQSAHGFIWDLQSRNNMSLYNNRFTT